MGRTGLVERLRARVRHTHGPQVRPVLPVIDLDDAQRLHRALGLEVRRWDDAYAWVLLAGHELFHLKVVPGLDPAANHAEVYLFVDDVEAWHARAAGAGLDPSPVRHEPWGLREFAVIDPSGNRMRLGMDGA